MYLLVSSPSQSSLMHGCVLLKVMKIFILLGVCFGVSRRGYSSSVI